jgi:hypothetical protein
MSCSSCSTRPAADPRGAGYDESRDLVYASDMNFGLWILRRTN